MGDVEKAEHCIRFGDDDCHWHVQRGAVLGIMDEHDADTPARIDGVLQRNFMVHVNCLSMSMADDRRSFNLDASARLWRLPRSWKHDTL